MRSIEAELEMLITTRKVMEQENETQVLVQLQKFEDSQKEQDMADGIKEEKKKTQKSSFCSIPFTIASAEDRKKKRSRISAHKRLS